MKKLTLAALISTAVTTTAIGLGVNPASAASLGKWKFEVDGGTVVTTILTSDSPITDPALITGLQGYFQSTGSSKQEPIHLLDPGFKAPGTEFENGTITDNEWLSPLPFPNNGIHLSNGGFAFYYGPEVTPPPGPDADDIYQVFYAQGPNDTSPTYKGCWGAGGCTNIVVTPVPEPSSTLGFLALGTLGAGATLKRKLKPSKSTKKETTKVG